MKRLLLSLFLILPACDNPEKDMSLQEFYPPPWHSEFNLGITRALIKNKVRGCGEYHYRSRYDWDQEYLVYCSRDGKSWTAYLVWPLIGAVGRPTRRDGSITAPY